jgi:hypothetical protein
MFVLCVVRNVKKQNAVQSRQKMPFLNAVFIFDFSVCFHLLFVTCIFSLCSCAVSVIALLFVVPAHERIRTEILLLAVVFVLLLSY